MQLFDHANAFDVVFPAYDVIQLEAPQVSIAAGMKAILELIDRELQQPVGVAIEAEDFAEPIERHDPPHRRQRGGTEQPVIPARIAPDDRGCREAAQAIGQQPFLLNVRLKLAIGVDCE